MIKSIWHRLGLDQKFVVLIFIFSALSTFIMTGIDLSSDYRSDLRAVEAFMRSVRTAQVPGLEKSVWTVDEEQIRTQLNGLVGFREITYVAIQEDGVTQWEAGVPHQTKVLNDRTVLRARHLGQEVVIGTLIVQSDLQPIYDRILDKLHFVFITNVIRTFIVSLCIMAIYRRLIGRHLHHIADYFSFSGSITDGRDLVLQRRRDGVYGFDELDVLVEAINKYRSEAKSTLAELQNALLHLEAMNRSLEENTDDLHREIAKNHAYAAELEEAKNAAEAANEAKSAFIASMSHELRTPLNGVLGYGQLLQIDIEKNLSPAQREYVSSILISGEQLLDLVNDILDLAQIEADRLRVTIETCDLRKVVEEVIDQYRPMADGRDISLRIESVSRTSLEASTDIGRFRQILGNLLSNAIKYSRDGGSVTLSTTARKDGFGRITVADTGIGIPKAVQANIFKPFERGARSAEVAVEGVGIGLAVSKMLAERLGGRIGFHSEEGSGSTFWVDTPLISNDTVLVWTDDYLVGVDPLDKDHQIIFSLTNKISQDNISPGEVQANVAELISYTRFHFRREEAVMEVCGYPQAASHTRKHRELERHIKKLEDEWRDGYSAEALLSLQLFLRNWWTSHIANVDKSIQSYTVGKEIEISMRLRELPELTHR